VTLKVELPTELARNVKSTRFTVGAVDPGKLTAATSVAGAKPRSAPKSGLIAKLWNKIFPLFTE